MNETSTLATTTEVSTIGLQTAYEFSGRPRPLDVLETDLRAYGIRVTPPHIAAEPQEVASTQPVSQGLYFAKVPQQSAIECYYFHGPGDLTAPLSPPSARMQGIRSSLRDVRAMLFVAAANADAAGETTRPLIRPERRAASKKAASSRAWIAQEETDITEVIRTVRTIHQNSLRAELLGRVSELRKLKTGWNSYSAAPPAPVAMDNAKIMLTLAFAADIIPERIEPSAMGGVGVTFTAGSREVAVEFYNAGNTHALLSDSATELLDTMPVPTGVAGYSKLLQDIRRYLYGHDATAQARQPTLPRR
jgi:hypothetical protein